MSLVDTHAHIFLEEFDSDQRAMLDRAREAGIEKILMPAIDSDTHERLFSLAASQPELCKPMIGLHPCSVKENYLDELKIIADFLEKQKVVAIGEIGLDFYWDLSFRDQQHEAFGQQLQWARERGLPVSIHSRNATDECIAQVKELQDGRLRGVFHCFSGTVEQARKIIDLGFHLGIGGVLTFKNAGLDKVVKDLDLSHLVLETDAPYLAPVPYRGKRNESAYLKPVAQKLADIKEMSLDLIEKITTENAKKLFGL